MNPPSPSPGMASRQTTARPWTAQSRPATARPQTATSTRHEYTYVIAVLEGRGVAREVGIAALEKDTSRVTLVQVCSSGKLYQYLDELVVLQLADGQTYVKTLHQMNLHNPSLIIVPDTFLSASDAASKSSPPTSILVKYMEEEFPGVPIEPVARKYWNDQTGTC